MYHELRGSLGGLTSSHVHQVLRLASESPSGRSSELPGNIGVERVFDTLVFSVSKQAPRPRGGRETRATANAYRYVVSLPTHGVATVSVPELNRRFRLKVIDWSDSERDTKRDSATALDAEIASRTLDLAELAAGGCLPPDGTQAVEEIEGNVSGGSRS